jgi:hypothetical protein
VRSFSSASSSDRAKSIDDSGTTRATLAEHRQDYLINRQDRVILCL